MTNKYKAEEHIVAFNEIYHEFKGIPVTKGIICERLREIGLPSTNTFFSLLTKFHVIERVKKGRYIFATPKEGDRFYVGLLESILNTYSKKIKEYSDRHIAKKKQVIEEVPEEKYEIVLSNPIEEAIRLLKANGYQILKPISVVYGLV